MQNTTSAMIATIATTPPTAPPTIAPRLLLGFDGVSAMEKKNEESETYEAAAAEEEGPAGEPDE
jgi:hypothetical protein